MLATFFCSKNSWQLLLQDSKDLLQSFQDKLLRQSEDLSIMFK